jgi:hypothetical protein
MKECTKWTSGVMRRSLRPLIILTFLAAFAFPLSAQQVDSRIERIRRITTQINEQVAESERVEEGTGIYCNELIVNRGDKSWPAVGIYRTVVSFYYTFGDREKNPYPNRLLKITLNTQRSDRIEHAEYIFDPAQQLIFYYEKDGDDPASERRYYLASERVIRAMKGQRTIGLRNRDEVEKVSMVLKEKNRLKSMFIQSLAD